MAPAGLLHSYIRDNGKEDGNQRWRLRHFCLQSAKSLQFNVLGRMLATSTS